MFREFLSGFPRSLSVEVRSPPHGRTRVPGLTSIGQWRSTDLRHGQCICSSDVIRCSGDMGYGPWPVPMPCPSNKFEVFAQNACSIPIVHFMKIHELWIQVIHGFELVRVQAVLRIDLQETLGHSRGNQHNYSSDTWISHLCCRLVARVFSCSIGHVWLWLPALWLQSQVWKIQGATVPP